MALNSTCNSLATDYRSIYKRSRFDNYYTTSRDTYSASCFVVEIRKNGKPMICLYCVSDFLFLPAEKWSGHGLTSRYGSYAYVFLYLLFLNSQLQYTNLFCHCLLAKSPSFNLLVLRIYTYT